MTSRLPLAVLLCAVALGVVGMHGLGAGQDVGGQAGHHAVLTVATTAADSVGMGDFAGPVVEENAPPSATPGLLGLCLMMLTSGLGLGVLVAAARGGAWCRLRLADLAAATGAAAAAVLPPPPRRQLTVLRI